MSARDVAVLELDGRQLPNWRPNAFKRSVRRPPITDPRDRALADHLVAGVVKNLLLLQHLTQHYSDRKLKSIEAGVQKILAVGLYQLQFLTRIPARAAVDEAVEQTRRLGLKNAAGFVNAVLRKATREPNSPLPDESRDPRSFAETALSHPAELFDHLVTSFGVNEALRICRHNQSEPPIIVRLLDGASIEALARPEVAVTPHSVPGLVVVENVNRRLLAEWSAAGLAQAQDPTSAAVVAMLDIQPGQRVLDRCCGRGTKTRQMIEALRSSGHITAMDPATDRIESLRSTLATRNLTHVDIVRGEMLGATPGVADASFDRILIDAPCSNSGVLARRPEARYRQTKASLVSIIALQQAILEDTLPVLAPGGKLAYSTCSIWPEENEQLITAILQRHQDLTMIDERAIRPQSDGNPAHYHDGGYVAVLQRRPG